MNTEQLRADFEAWIASPPYERKPLGINPEASGFPGQYRAYEVQLAWEAYQAGRAALTAQPAASAEPVAWVAADTLNSPHPTCVSSLAYMSQFDKDRGREYVPLYAAPVAAAEREEYAKMVDALRIARSHIKWREFGECRADGWEGPPPTAAQAVASIDVALSATQGEPDVSAEPSDMARDAARYRWLRLNAREAWDGGTLLDAIESGGRRLDTAIDAAIQRTTGREGSKQ